MIYLAIDDYTHDEYAYENKPIKDENGNWKASGKMINLPYGTIKALTFKDIYELDAIEYNATIETIVKEALKTCSNCEYALSGHNYYCTKYNYPTNEDYRCCSYKPKLKIKVKIVC